MDQSTYASTALQPGFDPGTPAAGPFVVNLCASVAPIDLKPGSMPGLERYRLYQVRRVEDNRPRYRLRLGFFPSEAASEVVLAAIREFYPAAFCVPAGSDDLKHAPGFDPATFGARPAQVDSGDTSPTSRMQRLQPVAAAVKPAAPSAPPVTVAATAKPVPPAPAPRQQTAVAAAPKKPHAKIELLPETPPRSPAAQAAEATAQPFRVKPADPAVMNKAANLQLASELPEDIRKLAGMMATAKTEGPVLIDSTQTLRILTETELADSDGPAWFSVQVTVSDQPINIDAMPKLDIFKAFRLYSIAQTRQGRIEHALRLGFFRESVSAEAVSGYLKTFFGAPEVLRVSAAEQTRFADPPAPPVLSDSAGNSARVVQLHPDKPAMQKPATAPVLTNAPTPKATPPAAKQPVAPPAAKPVKLAAASAVARKSSAAPGKRTSSKSRSLNDLLVEEAREVALSESGIRRMEAKGSLLSRLVGKLTR
ncbi:MAG: hypothetical protein ABL964_12415 [Steroidobacteraceae bacterium]